MALAITLIIVFAVVGVAVYFGVKISAENKQKIEQGIMVNRQKSFWDTPFWKLESAYKLNAGWDAVWAALKAADYHGSISSGKKQQGYCAVKYENKPNNFAAVFRKLKTEPGEPTMYVFQFTYWKEYRGTPNGMTLMNVLLTTIEKVLLRVDPGTLVETRRADFSTKSNFF